MNNTDKDFLRCLSDMFLSSEYYKEDLKSSCSVCGERVVFTEGTLNIKPEIPLSEIISNCVHNIYSIVCDKCQGISKCADKACVYWIRGREHINILRDGYIGITKDFNGRLQQHLLSASKTLTSHKKEMRERLISGDYIVNTILIGSRDYCLYIENRLRPENNIGWNKAIGGVGNNLVGGKFLSKDKCYSTLLRLVSKYTNSTGNSVQLSYDQKVNLLEHISSIRGCDYVTFKDVTRGLIPENIIGVSRSIGARKVKINVNGTDYWWGEVAEILGVSPIKLSYYKHKGADIHKMLEEALNNA